MTRQQSKPTEWVEKAGMFVADFARLPMPMRGFLMEQVKAVAGLDQKEKAYIARQLDAAKRQLIPKLDPAAVVVFDELINAVTAVVRQGFHAAARRDTYREITDPEGPRQPGE